jgi:hypothetical protein
VHVDGAAYFARLHQLFSGLDACDWLYLTGWRIDATRQLAGPGSELGPLLVRLARRGVAIRGLLWRSHPAVVRFNQDANRVLSTLVNRAGGQLVADQRVRRFGSHHPTPPARRRHRAGQLAPGPEGDFRPALRIYDPRRRSWTAATSHPRSPAPNPGGTMVRSNRGDTMDLLSA